MKPKPRAYDNCLPPADGTDPRNTVSHLSLLFIKMGTLTRVSTTAARKSNIHTSVELRRRIRDENNNLQRRGMFNLGRTTSVVPPADGIHSNPSNDDGVFFIDIDQPGK